MLTAVLVPFLPNVAVYFAECCVLAVAEVLTLKYPELEEFRAAKF